MSTGILFVTAKGVDNKTINELLGTIRDDEYDSGDRFHLVSKREARDIIPDRVEVTPSSFFTEECLYSDNVNSWVDSSYKDVEAFVLETQGTNEEKSPGLFVVLDDEGVKEKSLIVFDQIYDADTEEMTPRFNKVRIPWKKVYETWANLDIANMDFEDFVEEDSEHDDNWWEASSFAKGLDG